MLKFFARLLLTLVACCAAYFLTACALVLFPAAAREHSGTPAVNAYVLSNGVHTDLVFPINAEGVDWSQAFPLQHLQKIPVDAAYVAIGWGDREFYLHTPRWRDLTARRALQALSGSGRSLLHVTYLRQSDLGQGAYALPLSKGQYLTLVKHVATALLRSGSGPGVNVPGQHYGAHDAFYEARGSYNLFTTCNVWTGLALREAGVKVSVWTPLASQVTWHLRAAEIKPLQSLQTPQLKQSALAGATPHRRPL
jgi:uncharacterized protein (TIGR02117 family)